MMRRKRLCWFLLLMLLFTLAFMVLLLTSVVRQGTVPISIVDSQIIPRQVAMVLRPTTNATPPNSWPSSPSSISSPVSTASRASTTAGPTIAPDQSQPVVSQQPLDLKWLQLWSENTSQLWGDTAYIDNRPSVYTSPVVILFGVKETRSNRVRENFRWYCHIQTETDSNSSTVCTGQVKIDPVEYQFAINHGWSIPSYFICPLAGATGRPTTVSLSAHDCVSKMFTPPVPIINDKKVSPLGSPSSMKTIGICLHKALFGITDPQLIIQFIEAHKLFGVELFTIYIQDVSEQVRDVLYSYSQEGIVDVVEWRINVSMDVRDFGQVAVIHECLYRNRGRVRFLGFLDIDELFVPRNPQKSLARILTEADGPHFGSFRFLHVFMHNSNYNSTQGQISCPRVHLPVYFQRYMRSDHLESRGIYEPLGSKTKIFVKPNAIVRMGRHSMRLRPIHKFAPGFNEYTVPGERGLLFHYRQKIDKKLEQRPLVKDTTLTQFQSALMAVINAKLCVS